MIAIAIAAIAIAAIVLALRDQAERDRRHEERMPSDVRFRVEPWGIDGEGDWRWPR